MPLRYIAKISDGLTVDVPQAIRDLDRREDRYECDVVHWWSSDRKNVLTINEVTHLFQNERDHKIHLGDNEICLKYGFTRGDYLELVFRKMSRLVRKKGWFGYSWTETEWEEQDVFPARQVNELAFDPDVSRE